MSTRHRGGCRCGGVRFSVSAEPNLSVYCHCVDCRKSTGSPLLAAVAFPKTAVTWEADKTLTRYRNGTATRLFCNRCGSPIAQLHESAADRVFFNTGIMDRPEDYPPTYHSFAGDQLPWLCLADDLPRHAATLVITPQIGTQQ